MKQLNWPNVLTADRTKAQIYIGGRFIKNVEPEEAESVCASLRATVDPSYEVYARAVVDGVWHNVAGDGKNRYL